MVREVQTTEVREAPTDTVEQVPPTRARVPAEVIAARVIYFITGCIVVLLALRMVLLLLAANRDNGFVTFIYDISGVFAAPFYGIFSYTPSYGSSVFEISSVVAIIVYALVGWGLAKLVTLGSARRNV